MQRLLSQMLSGGGRSLDELLKTDNMLSGAESQRLRMHFSTTEMIPSRDLKDPVGSAIFEGDFITLKYLGYEMHWGPTRVPIYDVILLSSLLNSTRRPSQLEIARCNALHHSISTKPSFDPEYAQILFDAGGCVTDRNRYGGTPAHEIAMTWELENKEVISRAAEALKWYLEHGGNLDIKDTDGKAPRETIDITRKHVARGLRMETWKVVDDEDRRRKRLADRICTFCGRPPRGDVRLLARYCSGLTCQKADWPHHKLSCKKAAVA
ncbi:hypothetical protein C8Q74DRAFT_1257221 [Fomes fomentarius]|nr:hypothetical protein C8Q74DRAFT_1257221 [Fomes fomentarius]